MISDDSDNSQNLRHGMLHVRGAYQRHDSPHIFSGKVSSSHIKGETVILSREPLDEAALRAAIDATGYTAGEIRAAPYERKGLFSFLKK